MLKKQGQVYNCVYNTGSFVGRVKYYIHQLNVNWRPHTSRKRRKKKCATTTNNSTKTKRTDKSLLNSPLYSQSELVKDGVRLCLAYRLVRLLNFFHRKSYVR